MHVGTSYGLLEAARWTGRKMAVLGVSASLVVGLYQGCGWAWLALPWPVIAMLGTAASFIVGFKNAQTYQRTVEAQQIWSAITASSRYWGLLSRDFPDDASAATGLIERHLAWLTALRYQLRTPRVWEVAARAPDAAYRERRFAVAEHGVKLDQALLGYLAPDTVARLMKHHNIPLALIGEQSLAIRALFAGQKNPVLHHTEMQKTLKDLADGQARAERLKNFPYPRQYALVNTMFVWAFALLLPLGVVREFAQLKAPGAMQALLPWLAIPFSVLVAWMYLILDQVGESTENPFEGGANDVPITHQCACIERDLRALLGEPGLPAPPGPVNHILL